MFILQIVIDENEKKEIITDYKYHFRDMECSEEEMKEAINCTNIEELKKDLQSYEPYYPQSEREDGDLPIWKKKEQDQ